MQLKLNDQMEAGVEEVAGLLPKVMQVIESDFTEHDISKLSHLMDLDDNGYISAYEFTNAITSVVDDGRPVSFQELKHDVSVAQAKIEANTAMVKRVVDMVDDIRSGMGMRPIRPGSPVAVSQGVVSFAAEFPAALQQNGGTSDNSGTGNAGVKGIDEIIAMQNDLVQRHAEQAASIGQAIQCLHNLLNNTHLLAATPSCVGQDRPEVPAPSRSEGMRYVALDVLNPSAETPEAVAATVDQGQAAFGNARFEHGRSESRPSPMHSESDKAMLAGMPFETFACPNSPRPEGRIGKLLAMRAWEEASVLMLQDRAVICELCARMRSVLEADQTFPKESDVCMEVTPTLAQIAAEPVVSHGSTFDLLRSQTASFGDLAPTTTLSGQYLPNESQFPLLGLRFDVDAWSSLSPQLQIRKGAFANMDSAQAPEST
jgi:hypothetical protein